MGCPYSRVVGYVIVEATVGFEGFFKSINPSIPVTIVLITILLQKNS